MKKSEARCCERSLLTPLPRGAPRAPDAVPKGAEQISWTGPAELASGMALEQSPWVLVGTVPPVPPPWDFVRLQREAGREKAEPAAR